MHIDESNLYRTFDFANASALLALGYKLELLDRSRPDGRVDFCFIRDGGLDEAVQAHFAGNLKLSTVSYFSAQRSLKSRLHNEMGDRR